MSDYTPTAERVRYAASNGGVWLAYAPESFDRWLAAHDAELTEKVRRETLAEVADKIDRLYAGTDGTAIERAWIGGVQASAAAIRTLSTTPTPERSN